jgi:hypothetical protein
MRCWIPSVVALLCTLGGCARAPFAASGPDHHNGRYAGVGVYSPSTQWANVIAATRSADPAAARPGDDQAIIVVQDTRTGDLRACGDLTGYCVGMNPWKTTLTMAQVAPVKLTAHASETVERAAAPSEPKAIDHDGR